MKEKKLQADTVKTRIQILKDTCFKTVQFTYPKKLTSEQIVQEKNNFTQNAIKIDIADKQLQEAKEFHKSETQPVKEVMKIQIGKIRTGVEEVTEFVYLLDDQEEGKIGYYNAKGILVYERSLYPEERQLRIVNTTIQEQQ